MMVSNMHVRLWLPPVVVAVVFVWVCGGRGYELLEAAMLVMLGPLSTHVPCAVMLPWQP